MRFPYRSFDVTAGGQPIVVFPFDSDQPVTRAGPSRLIDWLDDVRQHVASGQSSSRK